MESERRGHCDAPRHAVGVLADDRGVEQDVACLTHGAQASALTRGTSAGYQSLVTTRTMPAGVGGRPA